MCHIYDINHSVLFLDEFTLLPSLLPPPPPPPPPDPAPSRVISSSDRT